MLIIVKIIAYIYKNLRYPKIAILLIVALVNISAFFLLYCSTKSSLIERKINSYIRKHIYFSLCSQVPHTCSQSSLMPICGIPSYGFPGSVAFHSTISAAFLVSSSLVMSIQTAYGASFAPFSLSDQTISILLFQFFLIYCVLSVLFSLCLLHTGLLPSHHF